MEIYQDGMFHVVKFGGMYYRFSEFSSVVPMSDFEILCTQMNGSKDGNIIEMKISIDLRTMERKTILVKKLRNMW